MGKKLLLMLTLMAVALSATAVEGGSDFTVTRISNPLNAPGEVDGLMPGGFRENSYAWRMAMRGDEIYIATARNLANDVVSLFAPLLTSQGISMDTYIAIVDAITNGDIPHPTTADEGANIVTYNRKTGEFKVAYTAEAGVFFRMAVTFGDDIYFGSYTSHADLPQYILKLDADGNFTKVFETHNSVSLRANCVYDDHLYFAGADEREVVAEGEDRTPSKIAILRKSNDDDTVWERVADYKDFGELAFDPIMSNSAGCPVWELATHDGYIYSSHPSTEGMVIYRGHPAQGDETPNEYGWYWEEVAGLTNGINNPGLSDVEGGEPNTLRSLIGSVFEFKGELYAYNFDHTIGSMQYAIVGIVSQLAGRDVKPSQYLAPMYSTLTNPQKVWKLNDATGKFEECVNFTELVEGTTVEYVWRMGIYDDQLYISTMDSGVCYGYLTQLTDGSFFTMTPEERERKINYIIDLIDILKAAADDSEFIAGIIDQLEQVKQFLEEFRDNEEVREELLETLAYYQEILEDIMAQLEEYLNGQPDERMEAKLSARIKGNTTQGEMRATVSAMFDEVELNLDEILESIDVEGVRMYLYINRMVRDDVWGFDLFRTSDGENFEVVTRDGFGDRYNYGCPSFLATEEGLYIGTCNPFYGGQLYLLTNNHESGIGAIAADKTTADDAYYTITGIRLTERPTAPGIYIHGGKKVTVNK